MGIGMIANAVNKTPEQELDYEQEEYKTREEILQEIFGESDYDDEDYAGVPPIRAWSLIRIFEDIINSEAGIPFPDTSAISIQQLFHKNKEVDRKKHKL